MAKQINIKLEFHDITNTIMWDEKQNNEKSKIPCGLTVSEWLSRGFTYSNMKKYADKASFIYSKYYQKVMPLIEQELHDAQNYYKNEIKRLSKKNHEISFGIELNASDYSNSYIVESMVSPFPPVLTFVRINQLCDQAHIELKKLYQFGEISKKEYHTGRRELFRPLNRLRTNVTTHIVKARKVVEASELEGDKI